MANCRAVAGFTFASGFASVFPFLANRVAWLYLRIVVANRLDRVYNQMKSVNFYITTRNSQVFLHLLHLIGMLACCYHRNAVDTEGVSTLFGLSFFIFMTTWVSFVSGRQKLQPSLFVRSFDLR
jgi:hypothetical protein